MKFRCLIVLLALGMQSCITIRERMVDVDHPVVTTESGVLYQDLLVGTGDLEPEEGMSVTIDYVCTLEDETQVDSTYERGQPVTFTAGEAWLPGIDHGIANMRVGGRRQITVPAELAYGEEGVEGLIPSGAALLFELELIALE